MNHLKFSIPKPCNENWDAMMPESKGRFCSLCTKTVVDFTGMKAPEITDYLLANQSAKVCGRFEKTQLEPQPLNIYIPRDVFFGQTSFRKIFLLALLISMGSTLFSCKRDNSYLGEIAIEDSIVVDSTSTLPPVLKTDTVKTVTPAKVTSTKTNAPQIHLTGAVAIDPPPVEYITGDVAPAPNLPKQENHLTGDTIVTPQE